MSSEDNVIIKKVSLLLCTLFKERNSIPDTVNSPVVCPSVLYCELIHIIPVEIILLKKTLFCLIFK